MKFRFCYIFAVACALLAMSCDKNDTTTVGMTPAELASQPELAAQTTVKANEAEDGGTSTLGFANVFAVKAGDYEGTSWFSANTSGKMVWELAFLSIYFQDIDTMKVGDEVKPVRLSFSFPASNDSNNYTDEYKGKITLAGKGDNYVIFNFKSVKFSVAYGKYEIDGCLEAPLYATYDDYKVSR